MSQNGTIYIVINLINKKQYVGQTVRNLKKRIREHINGNCGASLLHKAIKKYGIENFKWISFSCPEEDLDWQETFLIKELNTLIMSGYNLDSGGNKNKHHCELTNQKISRNHADFSGEKHPQYGKVGILSHWFGRKQSEEHKKNRSNALKKYKGENHNWFGQHHKEETKKILSDLNIGENNKMAKLTEVDIIKIREFLNKKETQRKISKMFNVTQTTISKIKLGKVWKHIK
jgi:group I intron endonuclease